MHGDGVEDVDGVGSFGGLADSEWGRRGDLQRPRVVQRNAIYTGQVAGELAMGMEFRREMASWEGSQTSMGIRWDDAGRSTDMPEEAWRRERDEDHDSRQLMEG